MDDFKYTEAIHDTFRTVQSDVENLKNNFGIISPFTYKSITEVENSKIDRIKLLDERLKLERDKKTGLKMEWDALNKENEGLIIEKQKYERGLRYCDDTLNFWKKFKIVVENQDKVVQINTDRSNLALAEKRKLFINNMNIRYPNIKELDENDISSRSINELYGLKADHQKKIELKTGLEKALDLVKSQANRANILKTQIKALGIEYLKIHSNETVCPLCKKKHDNYATLLDNINNSDNSVNDTNEMDQLIVQIAEIEKDLDQISQIIIKEEYKQTCLRQLMDVAEHIKQSGLFEINASQASGHMLNEVKKIMSIEVKLQEEINKYDRMIRYHENLGFDHENIVGAQNFVESNRLYINFKTEIDNVVVPFESYIAKEKDRMLCNIKNIDEQIIDVESKITLNNSKALGLMDEQLSKEISDEKALLGKIHHIKNSISVLLEYFDIKESDDITSWTIGFETAKTRCDIALNKLKDIEEVKKLQSEFEQLGHLQEIISKKISRCKQALDAFAKMPKLDDSVDDFLNRNYQRIEYFFKLLHRPKEFISLKPDEDGISALRVSDGVTVKAHQMSAGQRASLALAVMFTLHLAAPNAPRFIIFDEPVANMDDLHLLNLIDILREFALQGTQIIFTTANPEVAGLFRRKFSFFEDNFKHFEFIRSNEKPTKINVIQYEPDKEEGHITTIAG